MWWVWELKEQVAKLTQKQANNSTNGGNHGNAGYGSNQQGGHHPQYHRLVDYCTYKCHKCGAVGHIMRDFTAQTQTIGPTLPAARASMPQSTPVQTVVPPAQGPNVMLANQQLNLAAQPWTNGAQQSTN